MKNKITDLNDHLFTQLERLCDEELSADQLEMEVSRADAIVKVSEQVIKAAGLQFAAVKIIADHGDRFAPQLTMIGGKPE